MSPAQPPQSQPPQPPAPTVFTDGFDADIVESWIADDPDEQTRTELAALLESATAGDAAAIAELEDRFAAPLTFGTAGLRGALGGGPNRMNRAVVIRAAAGLAGFLRDTLGEGFRVVIGCDARHGSADFARDTAAVVTAAGGQALLLPDKLPTPVLAFALGHLDCDAGVMVTASHNPPQDNGYKVYLGARPLQAVLDRQGDAQAAAAAEAGAGGPPATTRRRTTDTRSTSAPAPSRRSWTGRVMRRLLPPPRRGLVRRSSRPSMTSSPPTSPASPRSPAPRVPSPVGRRSVSRSSRTISPRSMRSASGSVLCAQHRCGSSSRACTGSAGRRCARHSSAPVSTMSMLWPLRSSRTRTSRR